MEKMIESAEIPMRWTERGSGLPVVMIHGIPTCPSLWRRVMDRLDGMRALAWEMVGYGSSIPLGKDHDISLHRQAEYLASWIDEMQLGQVVLVGHDLGGGVAQILAVSHPDLVAGLVLTNSICYDSWPIPSVKAMRRLAPATERLPEPVVARMLKTFLFRRGHDDQRLADRSFEHHWRHYRAHGGAAALVRQMRALDVRDTQAVATELPSLRGIPAAVVWGVADQFQKLHYGERLADDLGVDLTRIEGGKHFTPEDHPDVIAAAIHSVVADVRSHSEPYARAARPPRASSQAGQPMA